MVEGERELFGGLASFVNDPGFRYAQIRGIRAAARRFNFIKFLIK